MRDTTILGLRNLRDAVRNYELIQDILDQDSRITSLARSEIYTVLKRCIHTEAIFLTREFEQENSNVTGVNNDS